MPAAPGRARRGTVHSRPWPGRWIAAPHGHRPAASRTRVAIPTIPSGAHGGQPGLVGHGRGAHKLRSLASKPRDCPGCTRKLGRTAENPERATNSAATPSDPSASASVVGVTPSTDHDSRRRLNSAENPPRPIVSPVQLRSPSKANSCPSVAAIRSTVGSDTNSAMAQVARRSALLRRASNWSESFVERTPARQVEGWGAGVNIHGQNERGRPRNFRHAGQPPCGTNRTYQQLKSASPARRLHQKPRMASVVILAAGNVGSEHTGLRSKRMGRWDRSALRAARLSGLREFDNLCGLRRVAALEPSWRGG